VTYSGDEIIQFASGVSAYGWGWLHQNGYIDWLPTPEQYQDWSQAERWAWIDDTIKMIEERK
jgi:hypothetical protein